MPILKLSEYEFEQLWRALGNTVVHGRKIEYIEDAWQSCYAKLVQAAGVPTAKPKADKVWDAIKDSAKGG